MKTTKVNISEKYRIPLGLEIDSGLWVDRIGSCTDFNEKTNALRILGLYAIVCIKAGHGKFYSEDTGQINVVEHDGMFIFPNSKHSYYPEKSWETIWIVWDGYESEKLVSMGYFSASSPIIKDAYQSVQKAYSKLDLIMNLESSIAILERKVIILNMLLDLYKVKKTLKSQNTLAVEKAVNYVNNNIEKDITIEELAEQSCYSIPHFRRIFNSELGISPKRFLILRKIAKAKEYLFSGSSVKETAFLLGFNDEVYFRKLFKKITKQTPREFKKHY